MCDLKKTAEHTARMELLTCQVSPHLPFAEVRVQHLFTSGLMNKACLTSEEVSGKFMAHVMDTTVPVSN